MFGGLQLLAIRSAYEEGFMSPEFATVDASVINHSPHLATSEFFFNRVLVATDFSQPADQALKTAVVICRLFGSKLFLVHAANRDPYVPMQSLHANLNAARKQIIQLISSEPGLRELEPEVTVAYADARGLIDQVAAGEKIDLIVVGSHGASGLERLAIGSVAEATLRHARCPVLIVGPSCSADNHPFRSIVFATNLKTTGLRGAQYAAGLAERFNADLTFLHVMSRKDAARILEIEVIQDRIKQQLEELFPTDIERFCKKKVRLEEGKAAEAIAVVAESERASLIVVGLRDRILSDHTPWSTLSHVIREVKCPVLGVRGHLT
jgi:nucleotide-binding universal stress UspA family protein